MHYKKDEKQATGLQMVGIDQNQFAVELMKDNVHVNLTEMARSYGENKTPGQWLRTAESKEYIAILSDMHKCTSADLVLVKKGGAPEWQGTWATDRLIAIRFAQWLDVKFAIAVDKLLLDLMIGKYKIEADLRIKDLGERGWVKLSKYGEAPADGTWDTVDFNGTQVIRMTSGQDRWYKMDQVVKAFTLDQIPSVLRQYLPGQRTCELKPYGVGTKRIFIHEKSLSSIGVNLDMVARPVVNMDTLQKFFACLEAYSAFMPPENRQVVNLLVNQAKPKVYGSN